MQTYVIDQVGESVSLFLLKRQHNLLSRLCAATSRIATASDLSLHKLGLWWVMMPTSLMLILRKLAARAVVVMLLAAAKNS